jgi:uncharacterized protein (TIGR02284 family)
MFNQHITNWSFTMHEAKYDVDTLNGLIKTTIDSVDGYRGAAEDVDSGQFQSMFFARANERDSVVNDLQSYVRSLGGDPVVSGSMVAGAHRVFMNIRDAVTGRDDTAVIAEVERGEDFIKEKYEAALADEDLSMATKAHISKCYESVKEGHDQMRDLKHGMTNDARSSNPMPM